MPRLLLLLALPLLLAACADYSAHPSFDGLRSPNDVVPQPFPDAKPDSQPTLPP